MKQPIFILVLFIIVLFIGKHLLPGNAIFTFHDVSQPARIQEFSFDLTHGQIPPRVAPHMSFGLGYPVFNFYAPFSYWVSSSLHLIGFDIADSIKVAFLLGLLTAAFAMFYFLKLFFKPLPSLFGAVLYSTSPYLAMEIFARGNLGEIWFLALMPAVLYFLYKNTQTPSLWSFILSAITASFALTSHNVLSLVFLPLLIIYICFLKHKKSNFLSLALSFMLSSYFLIPAVFESGFTNASQIAALTNYKDHFLCWWQIWTTLSWGYGASNPGCTTDGISFMLGKIQVIFGVLGFFLLLFTLVKNKQRKNLFVFIFIALILLLSAFMSTYSSQFVWQKIPFLAVFQFPWRFLIFTLFGLSFFSSYFFSQVKLPFIKILIPICFIFIIVVQSLYFYKIPVSKKEFTNSFISNKVIKESIAYRVSEYLPRSGNYSYWRSIENDKLKKNQILNETKDFMYPLDKSNYSVIQNASFEKKAFTNSRLFIINVHYLPFWQIQIDNSNYIPTSFDSLSRPIIKLNAVKGRVVTLRFQQTRIELIANYITILGIIGLAISAYIWKKKLKI